MRRWRIRFRSRMAEPASRLYLAVVEQARRPDFYLRCGVPDTIDGRFDMIALHAVLVLRRLRRAGPDGARLAQAVFDLMFADMDRNLRELGVGDLSVGRRVKAMVRGFYGRAAAYETALASQGGALAEALARNLYASPSPPAEGLAAMAGYVRRQAAALAGQIDTDLLGGRIAFAPPPAPPDGDHPAPAGPGPDCLRR